MKVLITGGAGYIGTSLIEKLAREPQVESVIIYDNLSRGALQFFIQGKIPGGNKISFVQGDLLDSRLLKKTISKADSVVHLAAKVTTPFANTDPHFFEQVNHWGTAELVYAVEEHPIKKFIYLSSTSVYGAHHAMVTEQSPAEPSTYYGISKRRGEEHVERLMKQKNALILRGGNVYGHNASMRFDAVINRFMFDANFTNRIHIHGSGKQTRAFIHVQTISDYLKDCLFENVPNGTYNLTEKNLMVIELLDAFKEIFPTLEFIFSNQHMNLRELNVSPESQLFNHIKKRPSQNLKDELLEMRQKLTF